jgi:hypothetical protein
MKTVNFEDFKRDYKEYYKDDGKYLMISTYSEMEEIMSDLYDTDDFVMDYENEVIG